MVQGHPACVEVGAESLNPAPVELGCHVLFQGGDCRGVLSKELVPRCGEADDDLAPMMRFNEIFVWLRLYQALMGIWFPAAGGSRCGGRRAARSGPPRSAPARQIQATRPGPRIPRRTLTPGTDGADRARESVALTGGLRDRRPGGGRDLRSSLHGYAAALIVWLLVSDN